MCLCDSVFKNSFAEIENQLRSDNSGISEEDLAKLVEEKLAAQETEACKPAAKKTVKNGKPKSKGKETPGLK